MVITVSMPMFFQGRKVGVVGLDIDATELIQDERNYILANNKGDVFSSNSLNKNLLGTNVFLTNPEYIDITEDPLIFGSTAVSKVNLFDGNYLITKVDLSDEFIDSRVRFFWIWFNSSNYYSINMFCVCLYFNERVKDYR